MHPLVSCISFTGGDTGIAIARKAGMVPLQMELGGKDCCIVCRWGVAVCACVCARACVACMHVWRGEHVVASCISWHFASKWFRLCFYCT